MLCAGNSLNRLRGLICVYYFIFSYPLAISIHITSAFGLVNFCGRICAYLTFILIFSLLTVVPWLNTEQT